MGFPRALDAAEVSDRNAPRFVGRHAEGNVLLGLELNVKADLVGKIVVGRARSSEGEVAGAKT
jgi:hypothetical protein